MLSWAEREIKIAVERELEADKQEAAERGRKWSRRDFSYGGEIYKSALAAYKAMLKGEHSGMSWSITKHVLNRLIDGKPLSPLRGTDDEWTECGIINNQWDFQNVRCSKVFKNVDRKTGEVRYTDNDYVVCIDIDRKEDVHYFYLGAKEVYKRFPIKFPYVPIETPYKVYDSVFDCVNASPGTFNTVAIHYIECPNGEKIEVNKFYQEVEGWGFLEISKEDYNKRHRMYKKALERLKTPKEESKPEAEAPVEGAPVTKEEITSEPAG